MTDHATELARQLVRIGAVSFSPSQPYRWASGLLAPMYCDNRQTLAHPDVRALICRSFEDLFLRESLQPDAIVGVATGAIPHAAVLAEHLGLPLGYVRTAAKQHGKQNRIEGFCKKGSRVVVVEDLISTGGSSVSAANAAIQAGLVVVAVVAIFTYGFPVAEAAFANEGIPFHAVVALPDLMAAAEKAGQLRETERITLDAWRVDPTGWSKAREEAE